MNKIIEVTVSPEGATRVETKGFSGGECREASRSIENALGKQANERLTSEFFGANSEKETVQERS